MTKVYFACSIMGGGDTSNYLPIINAIKEAGGDVISEVFAHDAILYGGSPLPASEIFARDIAMIRDADMVIAEVSNPSLGVGYELGFAESLGKPILCLYNVDSAKKLSAMLKGNSYNSIFLYSDNEMPTEGIRLFMPA